MHPFVRDFAIHAVIAGFLALAWFSVPGVLLLMAARKRIATGFGNCLLLIPAFGLCTFGPVSLACAYWLKYSRTVLFTAWLLFAVIAFVIGRSWRNIAENRAHSIKPTHVILLFVLAAAAAIVPARYVCPFSALNGVVISDPVFDHFKVAMIDTMAREGVPPINPYYAPSGQAIPLNYYYLWHFLASQLKLLAPITGWQADAALTWFTAFALLCLMMWLAIRITGKSLAAIMVLILAVCGSPAAMLMWWKPSIGQILGLPDIHMPELLIVQCMWVPQHVLSAMAVVLLLAFVSWSLFNANCGEEVSKCTPCPLLQGLAVALIAATAFGSSVWVGGIALLAASPLILIAVWRSISPRQTWIALLKAVFVALPLFMVFSIPLFRSMRSGPRHLPISSAINFHLYPASPHFDEETWMGAPAQIVLYWLKYIPLTLGVIAIAGWIAIYVYKARDEQSAVFKRLSAAAAIGFFLVAECLRSVIRNNDLGWRAILVPVILLNVWTAVGVNHLLKEEAARSRRRFLWLGSLAAGIVLGLAAMASHLWELYPFHFPTQLQLATKPDPAWKDFVPEQEARRALHLLHLVHGRHLCPPDAQRRFARQAEIWAKVREFCGPDELVQSNPDGYPEMMFQTVNIPLPLFADRRAAYASWECATVFAYGYSAEENAQQYELFQEVFSNAATIESIRRVHDELKVKVLLVEVVDGAWTSRAFEDSGRYHLEYQDRDFKIYSSR